MVNRLQFYIDGAWVDPVVKKSTPVVNPATEEAMYEIALGSKADVDKAVVAARRAFETYSQTSREERVALLTKVVEIYKGRMKEIGAAVSDEMGAPLPMAEKLQAGAGLGHIMSTLEVLKNYHFEEPVGTAVVVREPVGVIGMITPWNWPLNQIACKVAPALAAGCTMILKPSEFTPTSALIFAEILHEAGVPKGVFNLINGLGPEVGAAMSEHPHIDMISFTGSTRAGIDVAKRAAPTVKRVSQELGGKSPNVILEGADLTKAVDQVEHALRHAGFMQDFGENQRRARREFRRLQDHGATGGERRRDLAGDLVQRPVPRRDHADDADRLAHHDRRAHRLFEMVILQDVQRRHQVSETGAGLQLLGHRQRRAHFIGHRRTDFLHAALVDLDDLGEQRDALLTAGLRIGFEGALGGGDRLVDVGLGTERNFIHRLFGRRIDDRRGLLHGGIDPGAVDVELHAVDHRKPLDLGGYGGGVQPTSSHGHGGK